MRRLMLLFVLALVLATGCAAMPKYQEFPKQAPVVASPNPDKALVYIFRGSHFIGAGVTYYVMEDTERIGALCNGSYFFHYANPGVHTYTAETESKAAVTLDCKPEETYYIEGDVGIGFLIGRPKLMQVSPEEGKKLVQDLSYRPLLKTEPPKE